MDITNETFTNIRQKRAAIYLRVSTEDQADNGTSLETQEEALRKCCLSNNYMLNSEHVYIDGGFSGNLPIEQRPALSALFEAAKLKEFDIVIIYALDRLSRNFLNSVKTVEDFTKMGIELFSIHEREVETRTVNGELMTHIKAVLAQHERRLITERLMNGRLKCAREGKWVTGVPPYGYRVDSETKKLVKHEAEAEVVQKFYEWLVYEKCSLREITRRAIEQNLPTPKHKNAKGKNRVGGKWYKRTINRILVNEVYTGAFYYNKYKRPFQFLNAVVDE